MASKFVQEADAVAKPKSAAVFVVAPGKSLSARSGILVEGDEVTDALFLGNDIAEQISALVDAGYVVERQ